MSPDAVRPGLGIGACPARSPSELMVSSLNMDRYHLVIARPLQRPFQTRCGLPILSASDVSGAWMVLLYRDVPDFAVLNHGPFHRRSNIFDKITEVVFVTRSTMNLH